MRPYREVDCGQPAPAVPMRGSVIQNLGFDSGCLLYARSDDEMMSHESYSENSAINLSTSQVTRGSASAANGAGESDDSQSSNKTIGKGCDVVTESAP
ncbi:forkhead box protein P4 [Caerostris darwini]|uniref:Forkhead box protein P4 n=1 Tax=Caerostris darwini TaxID=1538125 RepID=A0AAV4SIB2_9ARAC|nr:forkhead box protein P4 [Caerostris darwini]